MRVLLAISLILNALVIAGAVALAASSTLASDTAEALGWATTEQVEREAQQASEGGQRALATLEAICTSVRDSREITDEIAGRVRNSTSTPPGLTPEAQAYTLQMMSETHLAILQGCDS